MRDILYLARQYLRHHRGTTMILISSMTLILFLPSALLLVVDDASEHFRSRASSTPLLIGARGSALELVLGTLYFDEPSPPFMQMSQFERIEELDLGLAIPLHMVARRENTPIVGTTSDYLLLRDLRLEKGRHREIAGECVVGSKAAEALELVVGSKIPVSSPKAFMLQDTPLRLHVVGILSPTETPDDEAIFVTLKTTWIIAGLGHGHLSGAKHGTDAATEYTDITKENEKSFHFHGDESEFPISAVMVKPKNAKSRALLLGEYLSPEEIAQVVVPSEIMDRLMARILQVRSYLIAAVMLVSFVTLLVMALVVMLSIRLREREILTMTRMGCSRFAISQLIACQILIILACSFAAALVLTVCSSAFGHELVRLLIL